MFPDGATFFVVAGAGKSGTTALAETMSRDPDIAFSRIKEPRFFVHQTGFRAGGSPFGPPNTGTWRKGTTYYEGLFDFAAAPAAFGEASTAYFYCHESPELIAHFRPDARLVFVLRDPVARVVSQYRHERKVGRRLPDLAEMLAKDDDRDLERYLWGSRYATHLSRYLRWFPPEQLLVTEYDTFFADTGAGYARVRRFLGLPERSGEDFGFDRVNEAREPAPRLIASGLRGVSRAGLGRWLSPGLRDRGRVLRRAIERATSRPVRDGAVDPASIAALSDRLAGETARIGAVLDAAPACLQGEGFDTGHWHPARGR